MSKNVIITGTSRGIGLELVKLFSSSGFNVLSLSRNVKNTQKLNLKNTSFLSFDITKEEDHLLINEFISKNWNSVDILINNAGLLINKNFQETSLNDFSSVYNTNVFGVARLIQVCIPFMKEKSQVINISSIGGVQGSVKFPGLSAYSSSKGALITLTEMLAEEYKESKINFNVLALGAVQTEMLEEAFPGYKASVSAKEMADYIFEFSINGSRIINGKIIQISSSTP
ncbi:SDR family oxidoreductase [Flavobacteriaceae bacterium]|jgi:3-oxoacyl-[acyl-carrier protein] reductase|nr:SDR family oxidoreductase [Flavobacteriaceae bacterium]MDB9712422.1 SDR family oxidoreductase [Flavobacteriaceae bacterium]MDC1493018.1 SDR family oxidoreductase [Flavobacteriaceae bacterium]